MNLCCLTNDVETTSIVNGGLRDDTGDLVWKEGIPMLLDLYAKYEIKATFFFISEFAKQHPDMVTSVLSNGHEVGLHGVTHDYKKAFDVMPFSEQLSHLLEGKKVLEEISGKEVVSFRAPALRVNGDTPKALIEAGFQYDSSVAPQRIDMFMSLGSKNKLQWLRAPREPYYASEFNLARRGDSNIIEIPVSSYLCPYIGTFMRISPFLTGIIRNLLYQEVKNTNKSINFLIHPNEIITESNLHLGTIRRSKNYVSYLLSDVLRRRLKQKNLGLKAYILFENEIKYWKEKDFEFVRVKDIKLKYNC